MALKVQFSAGDVEDEIVERAIQGRESVTAKRDLGRYYSLLRRSLPTFTIGEARVIVSAVMESSAPGPGRHGRDDDGGYHVDPAMLWAYVADIKEEMERDLTVMARNFSIANGTSYSEERTALNDTEGDTTEEWRHALNGLVARLRLLTFAEAMAVVDAVERVASEYAGEDGEIELDPPFMGFSFTELTRVGLVSADDRTFDVIAYRYEPMDLGIRLIDRDAAAEALDLLQRVEEVAAGPFRTEKDATTEAKKLRAAEGDGPRRFVVRDSRDRGMLRSAQREEEAAGV